MQRQQQATAAIACYTPSQCSMQLCAKQNLICVTYHCNTVTSLTLLSSSRMPLFQMTCAVSMLLFKHSSSGRGSGSASLPASDCVSSAARALAAAALAGVWWGSRRRPAVVKQCACWMRRLDVHVAVTSSRRWMLHGHEAQ